MLYRRATDQDYDGIVLLQDQYLYRNLTVEQRQDGFLSVQFSKQQFVSMNMDGVVVVAEDGGCIVGYTCASTPVLNQSFDLPALMMEQLETIACDTGMLADCRYLISGPSCVDAGYRGRGVYAALKATIVEILPSNIDRLVTFISSNNPRSLMAAQKVGFEQMSTFCSGSKTFVILSKLV